MLSDQSPTRQSIDEPGDPNDAATIQSEQPNRDPSPARSFKIDLFYRVIFIVGALTSLPIGLLFLLMGSAALSGDPVPSATIIGALGLVFFVIGLCFLSMATIPRLDLWPDRLGLQTLSGHRMMERTAIDHYEFEPGFRSSSYVFYPKDTLNGRTLTVRTWFATEPDLHDWASALPNRPPETGQMQPPTPLWQPSQPRLVRQL